MSKKKEPAKVEVVNPDQALVQREVSDVPTFLSHLAVFFEEATELEARAKDYRERMLTLSMPRTLDEDERVVADIREGKALAKQLEEFWAPINMFYNVHRLFVAARKRAVEPAEAGVLAGNKLHNQYNDMARRKAQEEADQQRREAEERARQQREQEQKALEDAALKAEAESPDLSAREREFIAAYMVSGNAERSAAQAGYKHALATGAKLLATPKIQKAIESARSAKAIREQAQAKKEAPLEVETVVVKAEVSAGGRTTWGGEVINDDHSVVVEAFRAGKHGIPADLLMVNPTKLNEYGRALHERLDLWPGCRHTKKTSV
jgi:hypothetical protein